MNFGETGSQAGPPHCLTRSLECGGGWVDDGQIEMAQSWMGEPLFEVCEWDDDEANALQHPEMKGKLVAAWRFERR